MNRLPHTPLRTKLLPPAPISRVVLGCTFAACVLLGVPSHAEPATGAKPTISASQRDEATARHTLARAIVERLAPEAAQLGLRAEWREATLNKLMLHPTAELQEIAKGATYASVLQASDRNSVRRKALGSTTEDLVYKPVTPCRFVDTRIVGGKISPTRSFDIAQTGAAYGGDAGCSLTALAGVPDDQIGAVALNVAVFDTSAGGQPGFLGIRPMGSTKLTSVMNWGATSPIGQDSNTTIVAMDQSADTDEFEVFDSGPVHVIIDIMGVFTAPGATALDCTTVESTGLVVAPLVSFNIDAPSCPATYAAVSPQFRNQTLINLTLLSNFSFIGGLFKCEGSNTGVVPVTLYCGVRCCRVPGR